jgi:endonuclease/exonuclease/phosphatase (EEP) superfamily protein YafD
MATLYPTALVALWLMQSVAQARGGLPALAAVCAPYLVLPLVATAPLLVLRGATALRIAVATCLLYSLQIVPSLPATPVTADARGTTLTITTWNVAFGHADREDVRRFVETRPADIVALVEDYTSWWDPDPARWAERETALARIYPYQIRRHPQGLTILSTYPLLDSSAEEGGEAAGDTPPVAWGRFDLGDGRGVVVAVGHPRNPTRGDCDPRLLCYDPAVRDTQIRQVRAAVAPFLARGEPLVLVGDFNLTEREPAYRELADGLWDAQRAVADGSGYTWRPFPLARFGVPLLRLDYVLGSPATRPLGLTSDCTPRGADHCALTATLALP